MRYTAGIILLLLITAVVLVNLTPVQNFLARKSADILSKKLKTKVEIGHVRIDFLNHILLQGVFIADQSNDTVLYAGEAQVRITDWFIFKDKPELHYLGLKNAYIHMYRTATSKAWNYDFIEDAFSTPGSNKDTAAGKPFEFDLKKIELDNVRLHMDDKWGGEDQEYDIGSLLVNSEGLDFKKKLLEVSTIVGKNSIVTLRDYPAGKPKSLHKRIVYNDTTPFNPGMWAANVKSISLENCEFHLVMDDKKPIPGEFDYNHIDIKKINAYVRAGTISGDTIRGNV
ncbi:MAG: hypothetical protein JWQ38_1440, partial [Flavipsychrobacter sp.]|nr:hypothetical protein [Flavipsychrobacter sp.]